MTAWLQSRRAKVWAAGTLLLGVAAWLAGRNIAAPGLYYDEMLFINAARGGHGAQFLHLRFHGVPVLLMEYIGALKAWLYYPLLQVWPVGPESVRYPAIALALLGAIWTALAMEKMWKGTGLATLACLALDPALLMHARLDWGPTAVMFALRGLGLWAVASWITGRRVGSLWLLGLTLALGIFDKLNFLWFAYALVLGAAWVYRREAWQEIRQRPWAYGSALAALVLILAGGTWRAVSVQNSMAGGDRAALGVRFDQVVSLLKFTFAGGGPLDFVAGDGMRHGRLAAAGWLLLALPAVAGMIMGRSWRQPAWRFLGLVLLGTLAAFAATFSATGPHHAAMAAGLPQLVLIAGLQVWWTRERPHRLARGAALALLGLHAAVFALINFLTVDALARPQNRNWDPANQQAALAAARTGLPCVTADWGLGTLLAGFTPEQRLVHDDWPVFTNAEGARHYVAGLAPRTLIVAIGHVVGEENLGGNALRLRDAFIAEGWQMTAEEQFAGVAGRPLVFLQTWQKEAK